jgi:murein DD-endopeptidase MepM/ murein hydrolase activator NlpD
LARHRSPRGARTDHSDHTVELPAVRSAGSHRLPAPPSASRRGRITVAAAAAGAAVAAGQTVASALLPAGGLEPVQTTALLPVSHSADAAANFAVDAIGGDQLLPDPTAIALDPASSVDVQSLAKAVDIGQALARQTETIDSALAAGATEAHLLGDSAFVRPTSGRLTSVFGGRWGTQHYGIDIANRIGTPIYAFTDGVVEEAGPASGFGLWVVLRHPDGTRSVYGHVNRMFVRQGQSVRAGEEIAEIGNRGQSTGPHLHMEIWDANGTKLNPIPWLKKHGITFGGSGSAAPSDGTLSKVVEVDPPTPALPPNPLGRVGTLGVDALS